MRVCLCVTMFTPEGTHYYRDRACTVHGGYYQEGECEDLTWVEVREALRLARAEKQARRTRTAIEKAGAS